MHAISSYRCNRPASKQTLPPTHKQTGPITMHLATKLKEDSSQTVKHRKPTLYEVPFASTKYEYLFIYLYM